MGKKEEEEVGRLYEGKGVQNSLPELLEDEGLILFILYFLAGPVMIVQGLLVFN